ncbi:MAG: rhodanese-like domain-containing protein [Desulfobacteraceae bacterium]|nr:rhodanese-like domain-containing protein [Desulfobacteraceae bacterium]
MQLKFKILIVTALLCITGLLVMTNLAVTPKEPTWEDVAAESRSGGYKLIGTAELFEKYQQNRDRMLLIDTRQDWEYRTGHIRGAVNFPMEPTGWSRWQKRAALEQFLGKDKERFLVFY